jgi:hypothetical protein
MRWLKALGHTCLAVMLGLAVTWRLGTTTQRHELLETLHLSGLMDRIVEMRPVNNDPTGSQPIAQMVLLPPVPALGPKVVEIAPSRAPGDLESACRPDAIANPTRKTSREVFRWTDANGKVVFSDRNPAGDEAQVIGRTADGGVSMFSTDYRFIGRSAQPEFELELSSNIDGVFRFLADSLDLANVKPLHVTLTVIEGEERFISYRNLKTPNLATTSGFYTFDGNQAVVRWLGSVSTMAVARHEVTHLALGNWLGNVPLWLNEGLAEFVERLSFQHSYALAPAPVDEMRTIEGLRRDGKLPGLRAFLVMDRNDWNRLGSEVAYPYAWSLVHFLMKDPQDRLIVSNYLNELAKNRCRIIDQQAYLEASYPGGLNRLETDWQNWLINSQPQHLTF